MTPHDALFIEGLITEGSRGRYRVEASEGALWCVVRGRLRKELIYAESASARRTARAVKVSQRDPVAIGDRVLARPTGAGEGVIERIVTRAGAALTREDPDPGKQLTTVRGIEQFVIVFAAREPAPHLRLADRFIALAESQGATTILCVNKADQGIGLWLRERLVVYTTLGYDVVTTSATTGEGVETLRDLLAGRVSALMGPSGVGKSSLLNALEPGLALRVSAISDSTGKGRHTTTGARMVALTGSAGGWLADTAGIRALALDAGVMSELPNLFREFRSLAGSCAFTDCQHLSEPGCAVIAAARSGAIDAERYGSYRRLAGAHDGSAWDDGVETDTDWDDEPGQREDTWHANDG
ncbi:MAG TPA: ribosome small subunit-dependent GTPase A [Ktedonobacterales bacterium]|nr:ribosome small subunit-dependent GTPase A [Ktedonobacterales bacterium]